MDQNLNEIGGTVLKVVVGEPHSLARSSKQSFFEVGCPE